MFYKPLQAVEHPKFHEMIGVASRAKDGVVIPSRNIAREEILLLFQKNMKDLCEQLNGGNKSSTAFLCSLGAGALMFRVLST